MDLRQHKSGRRKADNNKRPTITPPFKGGRRLTFRIRRRGFTFEGSPSLLITDSHGVWSVTHRRYIRKTRRLRFHDLKAELDPIRSLARRLGMSRWPEFEELRPLRRKLAGSYWAVMPEETRERAARFYRDRRERRRAKKLRCLAAGVVSLAVLGFVLLRMVLMGCYSTPVCLVLGSAYLVAAYLLDMAWHLSYSTIYN